MSQFPQLSQAWYVRSQGKIRGPFSVDVLASMKQRGRVGPDAEVSPDRTLWLPIARLGEDFVDAAPLADACGSSALIPPTPRSLAPAEPQCFFSVDGTVHGPILFSDLQNRAATGQLGPTDPVWIQGQPEWAPAGQTPGLTFVGQKQRFSSWVRANPAVATCLGLALLILFGAPSWFVLQLASHRERDKLAEEQTRREEQEKAEAQNEKERKEAAEAEERRLQREGQLMYRLESLNIQRATLEASKIRNEELDKEIAEVKGELAAIKREQARAQDQAEAFRDRMSDAARSTVDQLEKQTREQSRMGGEMERTRRENEKQTRELERQTRELERQTREMKRGH